MTPSHPEIDKARSMGEAGVLALRVDGPGVDAIKEAAASFGGALGILKHCLGLAKLGAFDLPKPPPGPALFLESGAPAPHADLVLEGAMPQAPLTEEEVQAFKQQEWESQEVAFDEALSEARRRFLSAPGRTLEEWRAIHLKWRELNEGEEGWIYLTNQLRAGATDFEWPERCEVCSRWLRRPSINWYKQNPGKVRQTCWQCESAAREERAKAAREAKKAVPAAKAPKKASPKAPAKGAGGSKAKGVAGAQVQGGGAE